MLDIQTDAFGALRVISRVMDIRNNILSNLIALFLLLNAGCQTVIVNGNKLEDMAGRRLIRPEDLANKPYWTKDIYGQIDGITKEKDPCRIKYHSSYSVNRWMVVEGRLENGAKYPVVMDTGASIAFFVNDIHIIENNLAILLIKGNNDDSVGWGRCDLPELHIGQITFTNLSCFYREQRREVQILGIPLAKDKTIIAGLAVLRKFKYIAFDSLKKEVEFSVMQEFKPDQANLWKQYSFTIEEDLGGNVFLFLKIPISGLEIELQLDTGSGRGLAIAQEMWEQVQKNIQRIKLRRARDLYPYIGQLPCKRGVVPELKVGGRNVRNAMISVFPDDSPILDQCPGMLGMQYFQDTVMVLDFERDLMWVKNNPQCL